MYEKQGRVKGVELFQAGIRKGVPYYPHELDEAVANFNKFSKGTDKLVDPPVKIGHEEDQQRWTGMPRVGDVSDIYVDRRVCEKCGGSAHYDGNECPWCDNYDGRPTGRRTILLGDFEKVPLKIATVVQRGAYNRISAEFYKYKPPEGVPAKGLVFRAAGLQGGELPQVKTLKPLLDAEWETYSELTAQGTVVFAEAFDRDAGCVEVFSEVVMPKGTRVEKCVKDVKAKGGGNPYAICQASTHQNLHTGKPITHAELHSHLKSQGFMVDDAFDDKGVKVYGEPKYLHSRFKKEHDHDGEECDGEYSHKNLGKFNVNCYSEDGVKFVDQNVMTQTTLHTMDTAHHAPSPHGKLQEHLERHGFRTSATDDGAVMIHHPHAKVVGHLKKSHHYLGTKKSDVGSGETHAFRDKEHGHLFHVHTFGHQNNPSAEGVSYATKGPSAIGESVKMHSETLLARGISAETLAKLSETEIAALAAIEPLTFSDMDMAEAYKHITGMGIHAEPSHHHAHGKHRPSLKLHDELHHVHKKLAEHGYEHLGGGKHKHSKTGHEYHIDHDDHGYAHIIKHSEDDMNKDEMKAMFSEAASEIVKPLIEAAVADIRKEFTPISADVNKFKATMERENVEAFVEAHLKPNSKGETRVFPWELDGPLSLVDQIMAMDNATVTKFSEGGKEVEGTLRQRFMKSIELRTPRTFSEKMKAGKEGPGGTIITPVEEDKARFETFSESPEGQQLKKTGWDSKETWKIMENLPENQRRRQIQELEDLAAKSRQAA